VELLSPAGDLEKLETVYRYGADAAYIGLSGFSLRTRASDVLTGEALPQRLRAIKGRKRLYGALNIYFGNNDLTRLQENLDRIAELPLDALIVSDIGVVDLIRTRMPDIPLHLSTQANCLNSSAARVYRDLGFSRIIPAREMTLEEIVQLKATSPNLEVEVFIHGAMCLAYSGRCLLSAWLSGRSANKGNCAHSCRWEYRLALEEKQRPGEFLPVEESDGYTTLMSPKDLCMIDWIDRLYDAGIDAVKIEGRVKSAYYAAVVTRAYRREIDLAVARSAATSAAGATAANSRPDVPADPEPGAPPDDNPFREDLFNVSHREYSTGFFFSDPGAAVPTQMSYSQRYRFMGTILDPVRDGSYDVRVNNTISRGTAIEYIGPDLPSIVDTNFELFDESGAPVDSIGHHSCGWIRPSVSVEPGYLIRMARAQP
jgi:U32 family peptidase